MDSLEVNEIGGGVCESALKLLHKSEGLQVYARVRTLFGKSDRSGSQGGLRKRGCCARRSSIPTHQQYPTRYGSKVTRCLMPSDKTPTVTRLASEPRGNDVSASTRRRWGRMHGMVNTCELFCAVITNNVLLVTRRGFGGHPLGQPPYLRSKD